MTAARTFFVCIDNLGDIAAFCGDGAAGRVLAEIARRLEHGFGARFRLEEISNWGITASAVSVGDGEAQDWTLVDAILHAASSWPVEVAETSIVVALSCRDRRPLANELQRASMHVLALEYRGDMKAAAMAYQALAARRIGFAEQAVCAARQRGDLLYAECLARLTDQDGRMLMPAAYIPALERLGLTRSFDRQIVSAVVERLGRDKGCVLGCNISALSATLDLWWTSVFPRLLASAGVADRLVIEVTKSARAGSLGDAVLFVDHLKSAGCRVALDDFGVGFSSIDLARRARFDIIKIDGSYVRNRATGEDAPSLLAHLVALARDIATHVVVEGIESEADLNEACAAGAQWLQGYLFGRPRPSGEGVSPSQETLNRAALCRAMPLGVAQ